MAHIFADLYFDGFPIERMKTVEKYGADDDLSMAASWDWGGYWTAPIDYQHVEKL